MKEFLLSTRTEIFLPSSGKSGPNWLSPRSSLCRLESPERSGKAPENPLPEKSSTLRLSILEIETGNFPEKELFLALRTARKESLPRSRRSSPENRLWSMTRLWSLEREESSCGSGPEREFELRLRISKEDKRESLCPGKIPQRPKLVRERTLRFGKRVRVVKKESMEKERGSGEELPEI